MIAVLLVHATGAQYQLRFADADRFTRQEDVYAIHDTAGAVVGEVPRASTVYIGTVEITFGPPVGAEG